MCLYQVYKSVCVCVCEYTTSECKCLCLCVWNSVFPLLLFLIRVARWPHVVVLDEYYELTCVCVVCLSLHTFWIIIIIEWFVHVLVDQCENWLMFVWLCVSVHLPFNENGLVLVWLMLMVRFYFVTSTHRQHCNDNIPLISMHTIEMYYLIKLGFCSE